MSSVGSKVSPGEWVEQFQKESQEDMVFELENGKLFRSRETFYVSASVTAHLPNLCNGCHAPEGGYGVECFDIAEQKEATLFACYSCGMVTGFLGLVFTELEEDLGK